MSTNTDTPLSAPELEEIKARRDRVMQLTFALAANGDKNFRMSIPPQSDDSDMLLMALCADVDRLLTAVRRGGEDTTPHIGARSGTGTKHRWNIPESVWEFWTEAWGGWCVLRQTPNSTSPPMTYEEGCSHLRQRPDIHVVLYRDTANEPRAASPTPETTNG